MLVGRCWRSPSSLGTLLALLLDQPIFGRGIVRLMVIAPFFIMPTVSALVWKNLLMHPVSGFFAWIAKLVRAAADRLVRAMPDAVDHPDRGLAMAAVRDPDPVHRAAVAGQEQKEAAEMDGAGAFRSSSTSPLPHLARPITVVIMIETIFLLTVFAEIFVTTDGGPGLQTTNLAFLIYPQALLQFDVGNASAGGMVAVVIANIVAFFLVRIVGRNLEARRWHAMCRQTASERVHRRRVVAADCLIFFPILWMVLTSFKTELDAFAMPPKFLFFHWTLEN